MNSSEFCHLTLHKMKRRRWLCVARNRGKDEGDDFGQPGTQSSSFWRDCRIRNSNKDMPPETCSSSLKLSSFMFSAFMSSSIILVFTFIFSFRLSRCFLFLQLLYRRLHTYIRSGRDPWQYRDIFFHGTFPLFMAVHSGNRVDRADRRTVRLS